MEKKLDSISEEAKKDLDRIFEDVMVRKIIDKSEEQHRQIKGKCKDIIEELKCHEEHLEKLEKLELALGEIPREALLDEVDEDFQYDDEQMNLSSLLAGTALKSIENNRKLDLLKGVIGDFDLANRDKSSKPTLISYIQEVKGDHRKQLEEHSEKIRNNAIEHAGKQIEKFDSLHDYMEKIDQQAKNLSLKTEAMQDQLTEKLDLIFNSLQDMEKGLMKHKKDNEESRYLFEKTVSNSINKVTILGSICVFGIIILLILQFI